MTVTAVALAPALFALGFLAELVYVEWTLHAVAGRAGYAALYSGLIQLGYLAATLLVVSTPLLVIPTIAGHSFGSYLAVGRNRGAT